MIEVLSQNLPGGTEESHETISIANVAVQNRTKHLQNARQVPYRYGNPLMYALSMSVCYTSPNEIRVSLFLAISNKTTAVRTSEVEVTMAAINVRT
jgi:hypothetical protein